MAYKDKSKALAASRRYRARQRLLHPKPPPGKHGNHARGDQNGRWNNGQLISSQGYVLVRVPRNHHRAFGGEHNTSHRYAYEHDLVMEDKIGRQLAPGEEVHHEDQNKQNNAPDNLVLKTKPAHMKHHDSLRGRDKLGRFPQRKPEDLRVREWPKVEVPA